MRSVLMRMGMQVAAALRILQDADSAQHAAESAAEPPPPPDPDQAQQQSQPSPPGEAPGIACALHTCC